MLTRMIARNFKRFHEIEIELGNPVVFVGPNNSGKTSAMQALALWDVGVKRWKEKRAGERAPERRPGVTVGRRDLLAVPHPSAKLLWRDLRIRDVRKVGETQRTDNVRIDVVVDGVGADGAWRCGMEFDYANEESFYCRPLRLEPGRRPRRMSVPREAGSVRIALLPPLSGLAATETRLDHGAINVRIGEGRTAEVLRNLCFGVVERDPDQWASLVERIEELFGVGIEKPRYIEERGEIAMGYRERGSALDLSSSGRGLQQTLLILAYMYANPGTVMLLDEPDAHLEILRQRQIYNVIAEVASENGSQIIAASHSEVLLNEAAGRDTVIAFVGKPHRMGSQPAQVHKALAEIGFDQFYQAEQTGWVLYLEGSTDLAILQAFARRLDKTEALRALERPFVRYVGNRPRVAERHFHGLREALPGIEGIAIFDHLEKGPRQDPYLAQLHWRFREIENYLCSEAALEGYASASAVTDQPMPLFTFSEVDTRLVAMRESIVEIGDALRLLKKLSPWDRTTKASDDVLTPLFESFFERIGLPNVMRKGHFYRLVDFIPKDGIDPEVGEKLDAIAAVAARAEPVGAG